MWSYFCSSKQNVDSRAPSQVWQEHMESSQPNDPHIPVKTAEVK